MADQFAKLYERDGVQVVVFKDTDSDADLAVTVKFEVSGAFAGQTYTCKDQTEEGQQRTFDAITEEQAFAMRDQVNAMWARSLDETEEDEDE